MEIAGGEALDGGWGKGGRDDSGPGDFFRRGEVFFHERGRERKHVGDVIEAVAGIINGEVSGGLEGGGKQIAHGGVVFVAIQAARLWACRGRVRASRARKRTTWFQFSGGGWGLARVGYQALWGGDLGNGMRPSRERAIAEWHGGAGWLLAGGRRIRGVFVFRDAYFRWFSRWRGYVRRRGLWILRR